MAVKESENTVLKSPTTNMLFDIVETDGNGG